MAGDTFKEIRKWVLSRIKPPEGERKKIMKETRALVNELKRFTEGIDIDFFIGGSVAKGTFLKNDYDIDIFARFGKEFLENNIEVMCRETGISDLLEEIIRRTVGSRYERIHGSRDYYNLKRGKYNFEIVPVIRITGPVDAMNVTDVSPLHVDYVKKRLKGNMKDDVRIMKQFCKASRAYGAESFIGGFSGHVIDLLVIYYGSFLKALRAISSWDPKGKTVIDIEGFHVDPLSSLNKSKIDSPLILVDPIQPERNAAAALTKEKYRLLIARAGEFLRRPKRSMFIIRHLRIKEPKEGIAAYIVVKTLKGKKDVVGSKCMKIYQYIRRGLSRMGFKILDDDWEYYHDKWESLIFILVKEYFIPEYKEVRGPPVKRADDSNRFRKRHKLFFEREGRLYAKDRVDENNLKDALVKLVNEDYVTERSEGVSIRIKGL